MKAQAQKPRSVGEVRPATDRVLLADVAREAGVAVSTVSRTFAKPGRVNVQTAEHIRQVALKLGYQPRPSSDEPASAAQEGEQQTQAHGRHGMLAFLAQDTADGISSQILKGAQSEALAAGSAVCILETGPNAARSESLLNLLSRRADGIIIASDQLKAESIRRVARRLPTVVLNRPVEGVLSIVPDPTVGLARALLMLKRFHLRSLVYVAGSSGLWANQSRWSCIEKLGLRLGFSVRKIGPMQPSVEGGVQAAAALEGQLPDAIIAYNDQIAAGLVLRLKADGFSIPGDLSIIGFDNTLVAPVVSPAITSIRIPRARIGQAAVDTLLGRPLAPIVSTREAEFKQWLTSQGILGIDRSDHLIPVDTSLIIRRSTGAPSPRT
ncbi:hypothetical protein KIM372_02600 [Bombiscardovia nodaiensis]|uniref:HTH lacI-type domain-containing protein n=1 Tax=Bombiscardovia nodaiensis TaxID=2932181 RepID=A0ABM8B682_9BIFI|nr:hypothetical protein KIM372_02600 [Bombiscardovia nodaiensis]